MVGRHDEAALPLRNGLGCKQRRDAFHQCIPPRMGETYQQQACVGSRRVDSNIRKIQVLGDQKTLAGLSGLPDLLVSLPGKVLRPYRVHVVPESGKFRD